MDKAATQNLKTMRIVWGSLFVSQAMYLYLGMTLFSHPETAAVTEPTLMQALQDTQGQIFALLVIVGLIASFVVPKIIVRSRTQTTQAGLRVAPEQLFRMQFIIGCAINEAAALMGFLGGFALSYNPEFGTTLICIAMAFMLIRFPKEESVREMMSGSVTGPTGPRAS